MRAAGPFAVRCAVETAVTVPALTETLRIVREMTEIAPEPEELNVARDYLVGVFPLRFETSGQVAAALSGLVVFDLPDDESSTTIGPRWRRSILMPSWTRHAAIFGPASCPSSRRRRQFCGRPLRAAGLGEVTVIPADASPE